MLAAPRARCSRHAIRLALSAWLAVFAAGAQSSEPQGSAPQSSAPQSATGATPTPPSGKVGFAATASAGAASEASVDALLFDVHRIVAAESDGSWLIDELEQTAIERDVMESVCRATPEVRAQALAQLGQQHALAGDAKELYERAGNRLTSEVESVLALGRQLEALRRGVGAAASCPFWVRPDPSFHGLQSTRKRWIVNFDTGGTAQLRRTQGEWAVGAGGFGRVLGGYTFTRVSLLAGVEFGGGALVEPNEQPTSLVVNYIPALPLLLRLHRDRWNVDFEAAGVSLFQASNTSLSYGVRGGVTVGVSALRLRGVLPWVGLAVASEYHFGNSARPEAWYLRGGLRVGGVWDP